MKVLIVCTGNTCRSPMAEGILRDLALKNDMDLEVKSAGTYAYDGDSASDNAITAMRDINIDISNHKSRLIHKELIDEADLILTMSSSHKKAIVSKFPEARDKTYLLNDYAFGEIKDIEDPFGGSLSYYEKARDEIYRALEKIVNSEQVRVNKKKK